MRAPMPSRQVVEKALGLLVDTKSLAKNYDLLKDRLLANSGMYIKRRRA